MEASVSVNANECECECVCTLRLKVLSSPCSRRELVDFRYKVVGVVVVVVDTYLRNQTTTNFLNEPNEQLNTSEG